jgi:hypothetical protein
MRRCGSSWKPRLRDSSNGNLYVTPPLRPSQHGRLHRWAGPDASAGKLRVHPEVGSPPAWRNGPGASVEQRPRPQSAVSLAPHFWGMPLRAKRRRPADATVHTGPALSQFRRAGWASGPTNERTKGEAMTNEDNQRRDEKAASEGWCNRRERSRRAKLLAPVQPRLDAPQHLELHRMADADFRRPETQPHQRSPDPARDYQSAALPFANTLHLVRSRSSRHRRRSSLASGRT